ncbi:MAG: helix-turn-helix domain-containing protein [Patescibacteria group bacterium]|nr:helix-turn-helix domain-containing protein [Patescibacteria group bacterium]
MIQKILKKVGLSDKEIKIYLAGLKQGPVLANFLARQTGISRQNTYDILNKLAKKGLTSTTGKKYNTRFIMEEPANIQRLLDKQKRKIEKVKKDLELAMPEIESFYKTEIFIPKIKFYEGKESMRNLFLDSLKCKKKEILAIVPTIETFKVLGMEFTRHYVRERVKENIRAKTIRLKSYEDYKDKFFHRHEKQLREIRYAPASISFASTLFIFDNKVIFISSKKENFGLMIESEEYRDVMTNLFNVLWKVSK